MASKDVEEGVEGPICWICREEVGNEGIHPCACTGELDVVHPQCLSTWLTVSRNTACQMCRVIYRTRTQWRSRLNLWPEMERQEIFELFLLMSVVVAGLVGVALCTWTLLVILTAPAGTFSPGAVLGFLCFFGFYQIFIVFAFGGICRVSGTVRALYAANNTRVTVLPYRRPRRPTANEDNIELTVLVGPAGGTDEEPTDESSEGDVASGHKERDGSSGDEPDGGPNDRAGLRGTARTDLCAPTKKPVRKNHPKNNG
nr:K5 [Human gammaherpesvirus 8]